MKYIWILSILFSCHTPAPKEYPSIGKIEILSPSMEKLIDPKAAIEIIGTGLTWAEGPVWVKDGNYLLFSDPRLNTIYKWDEENGMQEFLKPSGYEGEAWYSDEPGTNGLIINQDGKLVACDHGNRRLSVIDLKTKKKESLIDNWENKKFNSPNDLCQHANGDYYFTDPPYGLPERESDTTTREIKENGVYRLNKDGKVEQIISNLGRPNGIALANDGKTLYVALSDGGNPYIMSYDLLDQGKVGEGKIFIDFKKLFPDEGLATDGFKFDKSGNLFAAAGDGIVVFDPEGKPIGRIRSGVRSANCAFATDGHLYMTANDKLLRVRMK